METLWQDIRYGARMLAKSPAFTAVAVLTLALGIGANSAIFSVVNGVILQPLPYEQPERLAMVRVTMEGQEFLPSVSPPEVMDFHDQAQVFAGAAAIRDNTAALTGEGDPEQIQIGATTANFLSLLGVHPMLGRHFTPEEDAPNGPSVVILGYGLWQRRFGGDPSVIGRSIQLDGQGTTVVGVMPEDHRLLLAREAGLPTILDAWRPFQFDFRAAPRQFRWVRALTRLKPGVTFAQAQAEMDRLARELLRQYPEYENIAFNFHLVPLQGDLIRNVRPALLALLGAVGFVLLIACANVANLLLARAAAREKEVAIRAALGANRRRIIRQMLTESSLLALLGGAAGLLVAHWALRSLVLLSPTNLPRLENIGIDWRVLAFALAAAAATVLLSGLVPALHASRPDLNETLKEGGRSSEGGAGHRMRNLLVTAEIALSLVLLAGAGLMIRSFWRLQQVSPGFQPNNVLTLSLNLPFQRYQDPQAVFRFFEQLSQRIKALPGVEGMGGIFPLPLSGRFWTGEYAYDEKTEQAWGTVAADQHMVLPGYFEAMGAQLHAGRFFTWQDNAEGRRLVIVDDTLAKKAWPGENPIGKQIKVLVPNGREWFEVIGVVDHMRQEHLGREGREQFYGLPAHWPFWGLPLVIRSSTPPASLQTVLEREVQALDKDLPIYNVRPMDAYVSEVMANNRFTMVLMGVFAGLAVVLASVGLYGVIAYSVAQRNHEIGVRMALGARPRDVLQLVVGRGLLLILTGVSVGLAGALALTRFLSSLLFGVTATDPLTFASVAFLLAAVALLACYVPARRAVRVDPMVVLRYE